MPVLPLAQFPPPSSWEEMEILIWDLLRRVWQDSGAQRNGRLGQTQHGVDIWGRINRGDCWAGAQVKAPKKPFSSFLPESDLLAEVEKAKEFKPALTEFLVITSGQADARIQESARKLTVEHREHGLFSVEVWAWEEVHRRLVQYPDLLKLYYPQFLREERDTDNNESKKPTFVVHPKQWKQAEENFSPALGVRQFSGDPVAYLEWRYCGPRFSMPSQNLSAVYMERTSLSWEFDLRSPKDLPGESDHVLINELGLEFKFLWRSHQRREIHRWLLTPRQINQENAHWEVGPEIIPPLWFDD